MADYKEPFGSYLALVEEASFGDGGAGANKGCSVVPEHEMRLPTRSRERVWGSDRLEPALVDLGRVQAREWQIRTANLGSLYPLVACLGSATGSGTSADPYTVTPGGSEPPSFALHALDNGTPYKMKGCTVPEWTLVIPRGGGNAYQRYAALVAEAEVAGYSAGAVLPASPGGSAFDGIAVNQAGDEFHLFPGNAADIWSYDPATDSYTSEVTPSETSFFGACRLSGGDDMVLAPFHTDYIGEYNAGTPSYTTGPAHGETQPAFKGAAEDASATYVAFAPYDSPNAGRYEISSGTWSSTEAHGEGGSAFGGIAPLGENYRYVFAPYKSDYVGLYNSSSYRRGPAHGLGDIKAFQRPLQLTADKVLLVPYESPRFCIYDDSDESLIWGPEHNEPEFPSFKAFTGATLLDCGDAVITPWGTEGYYWRWSAGAGFYRVGYWSASGPFGPPASIGGLVFTPPYDGSYPPGRYDALACRSTHRGQLQARQGTYDLKRSGTSVSAAFLGGELTVRQNLQRDIPDVSAGRIARPERQNLGLEVSLSLRASTENSFVESLQADEKGVWSIDWDLDDGTNRLRAELAGLGLEAYSEPVPTAETGVVELDVRLVNYSGSPTFTVEGFPL